MSKIEELIEKYCPNGVEYKQLKNVCEFQNGFSFKSEKFKDYGIPLLRITNIDGCYVQDNDLVFVDKSEYKENLESFIEK